MLWKGREDIHGSWVLLGGILCFANSFGHTSVFSRYELDVVDPAFI